MKEYNRVIIRGVPNTYNQCIRTRGYEEKIDVGLAKEQHQKYCEALEGLGLELIRLEADDRFPDCCFVEDAAIVIGNLAIISYMGAESRRGEEDAVRKVLSKHKEVYDIEPPGTIEGGDVLKIVSELFIGLSTRTNLQASEQVGKRVSHLEYRAIPVKTEDLVHLKSDCTYIGENYLLMFPGRFDEAVFNEYNRIIVPEEEAYAANCLSVNGKVLVSAGYPRTRELIEDAGFETISIEMSELRKGEGALTCLSIIF